MMIKNSLLVLSVLLIACTSSPETVSKKGKPLPIEIKSEVNFYDNLSEVFSIVEQTSLKSNNREILASIDKIKVADEKIYVLNRYMNKVLYVFNLDGEFLYQVGNNEGGEGYYDIPYDFIIKDDEIEILKAGEILVFDEGNGSYKTKIPIDVAAIRFFSEKGGYYFVRGRSEPYLTFCQNKFGNSVSYFTEGGPRHGVQPFESFIEGEQHLLFQINYTNTIYVIDNGMCKEMYNVRFEGNRFDQKEIDQLPSVNEVRSKSVNTKMVKEFYFELDEYFYFTYLYREKEFAVIKGRNSDLEKVIDITDVKNDVTHEPYFPWIIGQYEDKLIAVKPNEGTSQDEEADFQLYFLEII